VNIWDWRVSCWDTDENCDHSQPLCRRASHTRALDFLHIKCQPQIENSGQTVLKFVKFKNFTSFLKFVKIRKNSFLHISIKHKTIPFLSHTKTVLAISLLQYLLVWKFRLAGRCWLCWHYNAVFFYTVSQKKQNIKPLLPITSQNNNRFSNFFTDGLSSKFATNSCLNIPPRLKHVATLPYEIWLPEKWHQCEICIVINDKSQGSIAKHLRNNELFTTHLSPNLLVKELKRIDEHLAK